MQGRNITKHIKKDNTYRTYVYYYCSRKSMKRPCSQTVYTHAETLEQNIQDELAKYTILPEFKDLALEILRKNHKIEVSSRKKVYERLTKERISVQQDIDKLVTNLNRELIDEDDYKRIRATLKDKQQTLDDQLRSTENRAETYDEVNEKAFNFAVHAKENFSHGEVGTKRDILRTLGQSITLKNNQLFIEPNEWLVPIAQGYSDIEKSYLKVRTNKKPIPPY